MNIIVKDKQSLNKTQAKRCFDRWLKINFAFVAGFELQYMNVPIKIIAEKYLENIDGLIDYRFYCFNGVPKQVWVDIFSGTTKHLRAIFDMQWNELEIKCKWTIGGDIIKKKHENFEKMKQFASLLAKNLRLCVSISLKSKDTFIWVK